MPLTAQGASGVSQDSSAASMGSCREHMKAWQDGHNWKESWKKAAHQEYQSWKEKARENWRKEKVQMRQQWKAKGKGKGKGKWPWWPSEDPTADATEDGTNSIISDSLGSGAMLEPSDAGDSAPPGLEPPQMCYGSSWWKGKGHGKGKDWPPMWPWGPWEGAMMQPPPFPPNFW